MGGINVWWGELMGGIFPGGGMSKFAADGGAGWGDEQIFDLWKGTPPHHPSRENRVVR